MSPSLRIQLLGEFRLVHGAVPVENFTSPRHQALLAYLVLHRSAHQPRHHLAFLFWPDSSEAQARTNLRREWHHLRQLLPESERFLGSDAKCLWWNPSSSIELDVEQFESAVRRAEKAASSEDQEETTAALETAVELYRGDLLPSCYEDWISPLREELRQVYIEALERLVVLLEGLRRHGRAIRFARRLLLLDSLHERAYRDLMRLYALSGNRAGALHVYHTCATTLQRELGVSPDEETRSLYDRLVEKNDRPSNLPSDGESALGEATFPLVGRLEEWAVLLRSWESTVGGRSRLLAVSGEAGIGKTRLAEELIHWASQLGVPVARARSYSAEGTLAYAPVVGLLRTEGLRPSIGRLQEVWLAELARLLPELLEERPELPRPGPLTEGWQRRRLFEALTRAFLGVEHPLLLLIDDLQWCDSDTLEWLHYLLRSSTDSPLLVLGTFRSEELQDNPALASLLVDLRAQGKLVEIELGPLSGNETRMLASHVIGRELDSPLGERLFQETKGHPLFVVETARAGLHLAVSCPSAWPPPGPSESHPPPPKVQAVIQARLTQLSPGARKLSELAAAVGLAFTFELLAQASDLKEKELARALDELWRRRLVRELSADHYEFSHDKIREVVYAGLSPMKKRLLHQRLAGALEALHGGDLDQVSSQLAAHYERGGRHERALRHFERAAEVARGVYANEEAIRLLRRALSILERLPAGPDRDRRELSLQVALSPLLRMTRGYAAEMVGQSLSRARSLSKRLNRTRQLCHTLIGLGTFHVVRGRIPRTREIAEELVALARLSNAPEELIQGHFLMGGASLHAGEFKEAQSHFERGIQLYEPSQHADQIEFFGADLGLFCRAWGSHALWHLGDSERALTWSDEASTMAESLAHPFCLALAGAYRAMLLQLLGDTEGCLKEARNALDTCSRFEFSYYLAWAAILQDWALTRNDPEVLPQLEDMIEQFQRSGSALRLPYYLGLLAESLAESGRVREGLEFLERALKVSETSGDRWWDAELHRLTGTLKWLKGGDEEEARDHLGNALQIARRQGSLALEKRTSASLESLRRNRCARARSR